MTLEDHPGYLGWTSAGVIAIHADWPTYPIEHGWQVAIVTLGSFPENAKFKPIDDIDRCALLLACGYKGFRDYPDAFDERALHVAIWHDDLLEASKRGLISGVQRFTERQREERRRDNWRREMLDRLPDGVSGSRDILDCVYYEAPDGTYAPLKLTPLGEYEDEEDGEYDGQYWFGVTDEGVIAMTDLGWTQLDQIWAELLELPVSLAPHLSLLLENDLYDTAVRELGVILESRMRALSGSDKYGQPLVSEFIRFLQESSKFISSFLKVLRTELRTAMSFVRNEFAHNTVDLSRARAMALVGRLSHLLDDFKDIESAINEP